MADVAVHVVWSPSTNSKLTGQPVRIPETSGFPARSDCRSENHDVDTSHTFLTLILLSATYEKDFTVTIMQMLSVPSLGALVGLNGLCF